MVSVSPSFPNMASTFPCFPYLVMLLEYLNVKAMVLDTALLWAAVDAALFQGQIIPKTTRAHDNKYPGHLLVHIRMATGISQLLKGLHPCGAQPANPWTAEYFFRWSPEHYLLAATEKSQMQPYVFIGAQRASLSASDLHNALAPVLNPYKSIQICRFEPPPLWEKTPTLWKIQTGYYNGHPQHFADELSDYLRWISRWVSVKVRGLILLFVSSFRIFDIYQIKYHFSDYFSRKCFLGLIYWNGA